MKKQVSTISAQSTAHDFKVFINSHHPIVVVETSDEERIHKTLRSTSLQLNMELEEWTVTYGIKNKQNTTKILDTQKPLGLISYMTQRQGELIYWLKDFHSCLKELVIIRSFRELIQKFSKSRSTIFLTGVNVKLPAEIEHFALRYDLKAPSEKEFKQLIKNVYHSLSIRHSIAYKLDDKGEDALLSALRGMNMDQARQALAFAFLEEKALTDKDISHIMKKKTKLINEGGVLEFLSIDENHFQLGGFSNLKNWFHKIQIGFSEAARGNRLPLPKGILMLGVPGCGKSLSAKMIAKVWEFPLLKLDIGRLFDKYIGEI